MSWINKFRGKENTKKTLESLIQSDRPISLGDLLELDEIQDQNDIVAVAARLLKDPKRAHDAYNILGPIAAGGNAEAQYVMGEFCEFALHRDEQAATWFERAAGQGHAAAQRCYADMLIAGKGVERDVEKAFAYYARAAVAGIPEAQFVVGEFYRSGKVIEKDDAKALHFYRLASAQGYAPAAQRIEQFYQG